MIPHPINKSPYRMQITRGNILIPEALDSAMVPIKKGMAAPPPPPKAQIKPTPAV